MKILFLSRYQNSSPRGAEVFVEELSKRLSKNHQITVLSGEQADSLKWLNNQYDVVIPINGRLQSLIVAVGRLLKGYKVLISGHSGIGRDDLWNLVVTRPDIFVALTKKMEDWAKEWSLGVKVTRIPNGVDLERFKPSGDKYSLGLPHPIVLSVGALEWYKHHERTIEAIAKLNDVSLVIVGKGQQKSNLLKLGKTKLGDRFKLLSVDYQKMPNLYRSGDLFTLPSWDREAFGIVYLEAMASNLPVVAPDDTARGEIVGAGGILTDVEDPDQFALSIKQALAKKWSNLPRLQASKFSWDMISKRYEEVILELTTK